MLKLSKQGNLSRIAWQLGFTAIVLVALLAWRLINQRQQPELVVLSDGALVTSHWIHNNEIYWLEANPNWTVHVQPVMGGKARVLAELGPDTEMIYQEPYHPIRFTETDVVCFIRHKSVPERKPGIKSTSVSTHPGKPKATASVHHGYSVMAGVPIQEYMPSAAPFMLGTFHPGSAKRVPGETRTTDTDSPIFYRLYRIPRAGGQAEEVPDVEANPDTQILGDWVFWIKQGPDQKIRVKRGQEIHEEVVGHSDLMVTSLTTGKTRKLAGDMIATTSLIPGTEEVYWLEPHPYPDPGRDLFRCGLQAGKALILPNFQGIAYDPFQHTLPDAITEYRGRLYWLQSSGKPRSQLAQQATKIVSAKRDGSDLRTVIDLTKANLEVSGTLKLHRDNLYISFVRNLLADQRHRKASTLFLSRLHPERKDPIEELRSIDRTGTFDEDYCYYDAVEEVHGLWSTLTGDGMKIVPRLYRFRLPK